MNIRERLEEEMTKCYSLKLLKNRVKKCNEILPDCVQAQEHVVSFARCECKTCARTRRVMDNGTVRFQNIRDIIYICGIWQIFDQYTSFQPDGLKLLAA